MAAIPRRSSCFINEDDDDYVTNKEYVHINRSIRMNQQSLSMSSSGYASSPRTARMYSFNSRSDYRQPHFLDSCFLCRKSLIGDNDIFMYRGDTPFCSEECRHEQMEMDEAKEKHRKVSSTLRAGVEKSLNTNKVESYSFRNGTIVAV